MMRCPFYDRNPSMKLNDDYYYCFGCGADGDEIEKRKVVKTVLSGGVRDSPIDRAG